MISPHFLITCEHGGNQVPPQWASFFANAQEALASHRGYDPGALELAQEIAQALHAPLISSTTSRLLVELNRSLHHPKLFSAWTKNLASKEKESILKEFYFPYRQKVEAYISHHLPIIHLSIHSFTPVLDGQVRQADIGLLYDSRRLKEKEYALLWKNKLQASSPHPLRIRFNYPYLGRADGFTTFLRTKWSDSSYVGIELEINQKFVHESKKGWQQLKHAIIDSLRGLTDETKTID